MARKAKINTDFGPGVFTESEFSDAVHLVHNSIVDNTGDFTGIPVTMVSLLGQIVKYDDVLNAVAYPSQAADLEEARDAVQEMITTNGNWINDFADGNLSLLEKSGYPIAKTPEAQGQLEQTSLKVSVVNKPGELNFEISKVEGQNLKYAVLYTPVTNTETNPFKWTFYYNGGSRKGTLEDLVSKEDYKMVSVAMGTDKDLVVSEIIVKAPQ